jgi:hypothetical protein
VGLRTKPARRRFIRGRLGSSRVREATLAASEVFPDHVHNERDQHARDNGPEKQDKI